MKKVLKIIGAIFLICGVIALIVCMCAIPNETKEFFNVVFDYLDRPIVLCGVSITLGGVLGYFIVRYILTNTSIGNKKIKALEDYVNKGNEKQEKINQEIKDIIKEYAYLDEKTFDNILQRLETTESAISLIPNKKVQEALNNGKETKDN